MSQASPPPIDPVQPSPLFPTRDPAVVAAERAHLADLRTRPLPRRMWGYTKMSGPGWLQSAFSLGGGSLAASLFAGALLGYALLWVQPLGMVCGVIMLSAVAYQTLHTNERPLEAVNRHVHPIMGWAWAIGALVASLVWVLPQYSISVDVIGDMTGQTFGPTGGLLVALGLLVLVTTIAWNYGSAKGVRIFETITRLLVAMIVLSFALVVFAVGLRLGWWELIKGYLRFHIPTPGRDYPTLEPVVEGMVTRGTLTPERAAAVKRGIGQEGFDLVLAGFSAAVGINMTFLFPYSLRARGWGREHSGLAKFDLWSGMLIPFALTTSLLIIAAANEFYALPAYGDMLADMATGGAKPGATQLATALEPATGAFLAHYVFGLGVLGMTLSSIVMMMLVCGFVTMEITGRPFGSLAHRVGMLLPAVGVLGPTFWSDAKTYLAVPTSVLNFLLLPIAYISFWILMNRRSYLGDAMPTGGRRIAWNLALGIVTLIVLVAVARGIYLKWDGLLDAAEAVVGAVGVEVDLNPER